MGIPSSTYLTGSYELLGVAPGCPCSRCSMTPWFRPLLLNNLGATNYLYARSYRSSRNRKSLEGWERKPCERFMHNIGYFGARWGVHGVCCHIGRSLGGGSLTRKPYADGLEYAHRSLRFVRQAKREDVNMCLPEC